MRHLGIVSTLFVLICGITPVQADLKIEIVPTTGTIVPGGTSQADVLIYSDGGTINLTSFEATFQVELTSGSGTVLFGTPYQFSSLFASVDPLYVFKDGDPLTNYSYSSSTDPVGFLADVPLGYAGGTFVTGDGTVSDPNFVPIPVSISTTPKLLTHLTFQAGSGLTTGSVFTISLFSDTPTDYPYPTYFLGVDDQPIAFSGNTATIQVIAGPVVPEPSTIVLVGTGLVVILASRFRRRAV